MGQARCMAIFIHRKRALSSHGTISHVTPVSWTGREHRNARAIQAALIAVPWHTRREMFLRLCKHAWDANVHSHYQARDFGRWKSQTSKSHEQVGCNTQSGSPRVGACPSLEGSSDTITCTSYSGTYDHGANCLTLLSARVPGSVRGVLENMDHGARASSESTPGAWLQHVTSLPSKHCCYKLIQQESLKNENKILPRHRCTTDGQAS
ncbi:hypothetical protein CC78DRAFT_104404 [Lojkania enalia]|uniref:Uncharacterized protein n=1 Tax=Lojkania enalia TaxID=147567 RepID=A0A9P4KF99_9PLEO|nr:hypothetical protein CC78DRAFT_104404 [Didymosphaeria enalia]